MKIHLYLLKTSTTSCDIQHFRNGALDALCQLIPYKYTRVIWVLTDFSQLRPQTPLSELYTRSVLRKASLIKQDPSHPFHQSFPLLHNSCSCTEQTSAVSYLHEFEGALKGEVYFVWPLSSNINKLSPES